MTFEQWFALTMLLRVIGIGSASGLLGYVVGRYWLEHGSVGFSLVECIAIGIGMAYGVWRGELEARSRLRAIDPDPRHSR